MNLETALMIAVPIAINFALMAWYLWRAMEESWKMLLRICELEDEVAELRRLLKQKEGGEG